ncbi:hypothetical protein FRC01_000273 [Tulasnella sp. 417]|nr:hypothetical protein FRC01_000273 [Tulasnella sp. 417]
MDVSGIAGNASDDDKTRIKGAILARHPKGSFKAWIAERLKLVKVETTQDDNAPNKIIYRIIHEIEACDEMDNGGGSVHGGCIAHLGSMYVHLPTTTRVFDEPADSFKLFVLYLSPRLKVDRRANDGELGRRLPFSDSVR